MCACMCVYALQQLVVNMFCVMCDKLLRSMNELYADPRSQPLMETHTSLL